MMACTSARPQRGARDASTRPIAPSPHCGSRHTLFEASALNAGFIRVLLYLGCRDRLGTRAHRIAIQCRPLRLCPEELWSSERHEGL